MDEKVSTSFCEQKGCPSEKPKNLSPEGFGTMAPKPSGADVF
jgi:hypothetical protein